MRGELKNDEYLPENQCHSPGMAPAGIGYPHLYDVFAEKADGVGHVRTKR
ncbi:MAG: hypothetical protein A4E33_02698 [Methanoregula sp. PtaB.Bin085]|nr:MAG: hypothetical protein A4E33_02698 [Methanoregula sp. PtaB.Bin085]